MMRTLPLLIIAIGFFLGEQAKPVMAEALPESKAWDPLEITWASSSDRRKNLGEIYFYYDMGTHLLRRALLSQSDRVLFDLEKRSVAAQASWAFAEGPEEIRFIWLDDEFQIRYRSSDGGTQFCDQVVLAPFLLRQQKIFSPVWANGKTFLPLQMDGRVRVITFQDAPQKSVRMDYSLDEIGLLDPAVPVVTNYPYIQDYGFECERDTSIDDVMTLLDRFGPQKEVIDNVSSGILKFEHERPSGTVIETQILMKMAYYYLAKSETAFAVYPNINTHGGFLTPKMTYLIYIYDTASGEVLARVYSPLSAPPVTFFMVDGDTR